MPRFFAFLRAINVGGHNVTMEKLRGLFEASGFKDVETFIASGNVIFTSNSKTRKGLKEDRSLSSQFPVLRSQNIPPYRVGAWCNRPTHPVQEHPTYNPRAHFVIH